MNKKRSVGLGDQLKWTAGAFGIVLAYFGAFAVLMYPVVEASSHLA